MSSNNRSRRCTGGVGMALGATLAATLIGLANAPAARADTEPDPFQDLFGDSGFNAWTTSADTFLASNDPTLADELDTSVDSFLTSVGNGDGPFSFLALELDPSAFSLDPALNYAEFPVDATGDFATGLDYTVFASGLDPILDPVIWVLVALPEILLAPFVALALG